MSKRKQGEKLQYTNKNSNSLVHKVKTLRAELEVEKEKAELRLRLLKKLVAAETISAHLLEAIIDYANGKSDEGRFCMTKDGAVKDQWMWTDLRDENIYTSLTRLDIAAAVFRGGK